MRTPLLLSKASCLLLSAFLICCCTASNVYCQQIEANTPLVQPQPVNDIKDTALTTTAKPEPALNKETTVAEENEADSIADEGSTVIRAEDIYPLISKYAEMISVHPEKITNFPLYRFIDTWYGTRYRYGGCDKSGIDCSAFSQKLYNEVYGLDILRTARQQHRHSEHIRHADDANEGDLIFFRIHRFLISHVGIYLANGYFVHASKSHGIVISNLNDTYWHKRYAGCGRIAKEDRSVSESDYMP